MKKDRDIVGMAGLLLFTFLLGCGGESSAVADAGSVDTSKPIVTVDAKTSAGDTGGFSASSTQTFSQLATSEKQALCDQMVGNQGGYGRGVQCTGSTQTTDTNQASCVAGIPSIAALCPTLTVGDVIGCSAATGADLCKYTTIAECTAVRNCLG